MSGFAYRDGALWAESVPLERIAREFGTPCYVYSRASIEGAYREFHDGCRGRDVLICYAVKANSNLAVLDLLARLGAGFDIVSGGELARVLAVRGSPSKTVFSGVGKSEEELRSALGAGILCFNVESEAELERLAGLAKAMGRVAPVSLRVNPDVDANTHPYIATGLRENKFGIPFEQAVPLYRKVAASRTLRVAGIDCHIGSQLTDAEPFVAALQKILGLVDTLAREGIRVEHLDLGGGLGIRYREERPPSVGEYLRRLFHLLGDRDIRLLFEPGRVLVGESGLLLTRVEYLKPGPAKNFAIVDGAMNDLIRPSLYEAWHEIIPVNKREGQPVTYEIVGPICETGDFLGHDRPLILEQGDLVAVLAAGAYGMSMSSNYNTRPRPAEIIVDGDAIHLVRAREQISSLIALESVLP